MLDNLTQEQQKEMFIDTCKRMNENLKEAKRRGIQNPCVMNELGKQLNCRFKGDCDACIRRYAESVYDMRRSEMRLIDADMLEFDTEWSEDMDGFTSYSQFQIDNAPTIDAAPVRHAHWVFRDEDKHLIEDGCIPCNMWCSYCGQWSDNDSYGDAYCHNCGSRMDEPDLADEIAKEMIENAGAG